MSEVKNALLIFSKPPIPGLVKTRLVATGNLSNEQAAEFYRRSLYDVSELSMHALIELMRENEAEREENPDIPKVTYDFFVSTTPEDSVQKMRDTFDEIGPWPLDVNIITDSGRTFDDHFDDAFKQLFEMGYQDVVSVGGDIPTMPKEHIKLAFNWLEYFRNNEKPGFVQAPCQECGTSLVGLSFDTPINHQGIYYNLTGKPALDGYVEKVSQDDVPSAYLPPVSDVDEMQDLAHTISCIRAIAEAARYQPDIYVPERTLDWIDFMNFKVSTPPNENHDPRQYIDK